MPTKAELQAALDDLVTICERVIEEASANENDCLICEEPIQEGPGKCGDDCVIGDLSIALSNLPAKEAEQKSTVFGERYDKWAALQDKSRRKVT